MIPLLVGLTNKQSGRLGQSRGRRAASCSRLVLIAVFLFIETRAKEPIVPLDLWSATGPTPGSILATFFAAFGFFSATIFLPRFYQVVRGDSATVSGYELFPLLLGVIIASVGQRSDRRPDRQVQDAARWVHRAREHRVPALHEPRRNARAPG